jgi:hypothetical protein
MSRGGMSLRRIRCRTGGGRRVRGFWHCRTRHGRTGGDALPAFVPVSVDGEAEVSSGARARPRGSSAIEIGDGVVVRVPGDVSVERAAALVRALRGAA